MRYFKTVFLTFGVQRYDIFPVLQNFKREKIKNSPRTVKTEQLTTEERAEEVGISQIIRLVGLFGLTSALNPYETEKAPRSHDRRAPLIGKNGGDLLSHGCAVPSARTGLTSLFGMGRGGTPTL